MDSTRIMGILNVTPDSFYDGGEYSAKEEAVEHAREMVEQGADIIDIGGESTRPGADPVPVEEELDRVIPVIEEIEGLNVKISVDTRKPGVAEKALEAGADIINDVTGLESEEMRSVIAEAGCQAVLMDSVNIPVVKHREGYCGDIVEKVREKLEQKVEKAKNDGIGDEQIIVDPGIGFGKKPEEDVELVARIDEFQELGYPVMVGSSRKSFFGNFFGYSKQERLAPSIAANVIATLKDADILRVHDVEETVKAIEATEAIIQHEN